MKLKIAFIIMSISLLTKLSIGNENKKYNLPKQQIEFNNIFNKYVSDLDKVGTDFFAKISNSKKESDYWLKNHIDINDHKIIKDLDKYYNNKITNLLKDGKIENWVVKIVRADFLDYSDASILMSFPIYKDGRSLIKKAYDGKIGIGIRFTNKDITRKNKLHKKLKILKKDDYVVVSGVITPSYNKILKKTLKDFNPKFQKRKIEFEKIKNPSKEERSNWKKIKDTFEKVELDSKNKGWFLNNGYMFVKSDNIVFGMYINLTSVRKY